MKNLRSGGGVMMVCEVFISHHALDIDSDSVEYFIFKELSSEINPQSRTDHNIRVCDI